MDSAQWPQDIGIVKQPIEAADQMVVSNNNTNPSLIEKRSRPHHKEQAINCPRCNSTNTKFCYYNNYSLTQPRYFCKTCRRYWTQGGSLRNVPVGGGSRKNRRSSSSSSLSVSSTTISKIKLPDLTSPPISKSSAQNPKIHETHDLNLAFPTNDHYHTISEFGELPNLDQSNNNNNNNSQIPISSSSSSSISGLEFLRSGFTNSKGLNSFIPMPVLDQDSTTIYTTTSGGFSLQDFKPNFSFGMGGLGSGGSYGHHHQEGVDHHQESNSASRGLFPFENLRQVSSTDHDQFDHHHNREGGQGDHTNGYWSGMLGGGGGGSW